MRYTETEKTKLGMSKYHTGMRLSEESRNWCEIRKIYSESANGRFEKSWVLHHEKYGILLEEKTEEELMRSMMWYVLNLAEEKEGYL
tara:strand:+ start:136 stop:396 length:261 start_codon:yes stop_codon:yes gene_type:complete